MRMFDEAGHLAGDDMLYFVAEKIGPKQSLTPDGFLLCLEVPIANLDPLIYGPGETPIPAGADGIVRVTRSEEDFFNPEFLASFNLKPVVNGHPVNPSGRGYVNVSPQNFKQQVVGSIGNTRRGEGELSNSIVVDMLIMDELAIADVRAGKRQVSCGYRAEYEWDPEVPGQGEQCDFKLGNHVALVRSGRCGPDCAISDHNHLSNGGCKMQTFDDNSTGRGKLKTWYAGLVAAVLAVTSEADKPKVQAALDAGIPTADEDPSGGMHIHTGGRDDDAHKRLDTHDSMLTEIAGKHAQFDADIASLKEAVGQNSDDAAVGAELSKEAPAGEGAAAAAAHDSSYLQVAFQETVAGSEILAPGIAIPFTFDTKTKPRATFDCLCKMRRTALELAYNNPATRTLVEQLNGGKALDFATMDVGSQRTMFNAAVASKRAINNATAGGRVHDRGNVTVRGDQSHLHDIVQSRWSVARMNETARGIWSKDKPKH